MTINDLALSQLITSIHLADAVLDTYCANGRREALFRELALIELAARRAQERMNEMRFPPEVK